MPEKLCPLFQSACREHDCRWYIQILGAHPQTGEQLSKFGCAMEFIPLLLIENAKETRQHAAAVESSRNQASTDAASVTGALLRAAESARTETIRSMRSPTLLSRLRLSFRRD